jgi:Xaa-Pro aminopeptidase
MRARGLFLLLFTFACASAPQPAAPQATPGSRWELPALPEPAPFSQQEFAQRRATLLQQLGEGVLLVLGSPSPTFDYLPFAQDADFRYLTGIMEPGAAYLAVKAGGRVEEMLFVQPREPSREVWEGARLGPEGARERTGIASWSAQRLAPVLDSLIRVHGVVHTAAAPNVDARLDSDLSYAQQVIARIRTQHPQAQLRSVQQQIRNMRSTKSAVELDRIRRAVYISALAHREAMRSVQPGMNEFEMRALVEYFFRRYGGEGPAYGSIVGSGPNSTTLHYQASDRFMNAGEVLLIDAAASYGGYAADVTRTFPINGTFTPEQRAIYEVVLAAQKAAESRIRQGATWAELNEGANTEIRNGLARLGLIEGPDATFDARGPGGATVRMPQHMLYYMHGLGHGVGLAVHDPDISYTQGFGPGSAVTIEPGIYVRADVFDHLADTDANRAMVQRLGPVALRYRNIGVRVEDVYIFGDGGVERASAGAPREIEEIEALMRERGLGDLDRRGEIVEWFRRTQGR